MDTDLFIGGLASLILVAVLIVALTSNRTSHRSMDTEQRSRSSDKDRTTKSDF